MFKLIVLSAVLAVVAARPGLLGAASVLEPIGSIVRTIPTAISHSSQTQVHSSPIVTSVVSPVIRTIAAPTIIRSSPILTAAPASLLGSASIISAGGPILSAGSPLLGSDLGLGLGLGLKLH
ncbi:retinin-like [Eupeodes corollae]|uniref:retinin-like n=1 Tax=Eupeodes corollae TaxID=290404 RepID=UPI002490BB35|nr:retinin-like [Eupeodes corollae]